MGRYVKKRWFVISLAVLIAGGLTWGTADTGGATESLRDAFVRVSKQSSTYATAAIIFLMAFSLDSRHIRDAVRAPLPVLWASFVNYVLLPLAGWGLMRAQSPDDFRVGLMIAVSTPCTMAAASVWTRKAGGNDAVSLMTTLLTNALCFVVTPFWLQLATGSNVHLDARTMIVRLVIAVLIPSLAAQLVRLIPSCAAFADCRKTSIGVVAQFLILALVFGAALRAGMRLADPTHTGPGWGAALLVWGTCVALHVAALTISACGGRAMGFRRPDWIAAAFAGSQKTLPVGLLIATDPAMFGNPELGLPFAVFPMLMFHASQLFVDTAIADRFAALETQEPSR